MQTRDSAWPPPSGPRHDAPTAPAPRGSRRGLFVVAGIVALVIGALGLFAFTRQQAEQSEFDQRRHRADALVEEAASIEESLLGTSPEGWAREDVLIDRASSSVTLDRWQGDGSPDSAEPPLLSYIWNERTTHIQSHRFDDLSSSEPTWYLMEDSDGMDPAAFERYVTVSWDVLDRYTDEEPLRSGSEVVHGEQLERFDLFVPASAYEDGRRVTIGGVGMIDPSNGVEYSFWFADTGELRRVLVLAETEAGSWTYESWTHLSDEPAEIAIPDQASSWNEFSANGG